MSIVIYNSPTNKGKVFDLKMKANREDDLILFQGRTSISVGKKGDLKLQNNCEGVFRIFLDKERGLVMVEANENSILY